jgi:transcriptional regulator with XRE-family HTH domain
MPFGKFLRELREVRNMTLRQLGEAAGQDYVVLNKIEMGRRKPPPLEAIMALADALDGRRPLSEEEFEQLLNLAAEPNEQATARFEPNELERLKNSRAAQLFFTRRVRDKEN